MKKRTKQAVIRYHKFCLGTERELLYYSELHMFKPWRREEVDLLKGKQSYEDTYNDNLNIINANKSFIQHHTTLIDDAIREIEEHGPPEDAWNTLAPQTIQDNEEIFTPQEEIDPEYLILQPGN